MVWEIGIKPYKTIINIIVKNWNQNTNIEDYCIWCMYNKIQIRISIYYQSQ